MNEGLVATDCSDPRQMSGSMGLVVTDCSDPHQMSGSMDLVVTHCVDPCQMGGSMGLVVTHCVDLCQMGGSTGLAVTHCADNCRVVDLKCHHGNFYDDRNGCHQYCFGRRSTLTFGYCAYHLRTAMLAHCCVNDSPHVGSVHHSPRHDRLFRGSGEAELDVEIALLRVSEMGVDFHCVMKNAYHHVFDY